MCECAQLKLFYDPAYDRERVVDMLSTETELSKEYVGSVFDKAQKLGSMELCYQTAVRVTLIQLTVAEPWSLTQCHAFAERAFRTTRFGLCSRCVIRNHQYS